MPQFPGKAWIGFVNFSNLPVQVCLPVQVSLTELYIF